MKYEFDIELVFNPLPHQNYIHFTRNGAYKDPKFKHYQDHIGWAAKSKMNEKGWDMIEGDFQLDIVFYCEKNKKRGDKTNMYKSVEDALNGVAYTDDKNNMKDVSEIRYSPKGEPPRLIISVKPLGK